MSKFNVLELYVGEFNMESVIEYEKEPFEYKGEKYYVISDLSKSNYYYTRTTLKDNNNDGIYKLQQNKFILYKLKNASINYLTALVSDGNREEYVLLGSCKNGYELNNLLNKFDFIKEFPLLSYQLLKSSLYSKSNKDLIDFKNSKLYTTDYANMLNYTYFISFASFGGYSAEDVTLYNNEYNSLLESKKLTGSNAANLIRDAFELMCCNLVTTEEGLSRVYSLIDYIVSNDKYPITQPELYSWTDLSKSNELSRALYKYIYETYDLFNNKKLAKLVLQLIPNGILVKTMSVFDILIHYNMYNKLLEKFIKMNVVELGDKINMIDKKRAMAKLSKSFCKTYLVNTDSSNESLRLVNSFVDILGEESVTKNRSSFLALGFLVNSLNLEELKDGDISLLTNVLASDIISSRMPDYKINDDVVSTILGTDNKCMNYIAEKVIYEIYYNKSYKFSAKIKLINDNYSKSDIMNYYNNALEKLIDDENFPEKGKNAIIKCKLESNI